MLDEEFADIPSIPQEDGDAPVVRIKYVPEFEAAMSKFRGLLQLDERSERALRLTEHVIDLNAANYTAWVYRRKCLDALDSRDLWQKELEWCGDVIENNQKNYQVWFHRRRCVERLGAAGEAELAFVAECLADEPKNYHAWGYRQWLLRIAGLWDEELAYTARCIREDPFNNSAWNQRFFVLQETGRLRDAGAVQGEMDFAMAHAAGDPFNQSPWSYFLGLVAVHPSGAEALDKAVKMVEPVADQHANCPQAHGTLAELLVKTGDVDALRRAAQACDKLGRDIDPIRAKYWALRHDEISATLAAASAGLGGDS